MRKIFFIILLCAVVYGLYAQEQPPDSVQVLKSVTVSASRLTQASLKQNVFDATVLQQHIHQNLADLLAHESHLYVKSYGAGALASVSLRGTNAHHTAVLWNGININSPMNGITDFSLIPVGLYDIINIQYGGSSSLWGSGAIAGAIHLNNMAILNRGTSSKFSFSAGSFGTFKQSADVMLSRKKMCSSLKIYNSTAQNNFAYTNLFLADKPLVKQQNAEVRGKGLMSENHFLMKDNQKINFLVWYHMADRNLPPSMAEVHSKTKQTDNNLKISSEWAFLKNKTTAYIRGAFFNDVQNYNDSLAQIFALNSFITVVGEGEVKIDLNKSHHVNIGVNNTYTAAKATNLPSAPKQNNTALFAAYSFIDKHQKLRLNVSGRQEWMPNLTIPLTFSLGTSYALLKSTALFAQIAKVHRLPTLNDLYWSPGGNSNLFPEDGYTHELGLKFNYKYRHVSFSTSPSVFSNRINNWIMWLPEANYWKPQNIMEVWSRGFETHSDIKMHRKDGHIGISVLTNYVLSSNQKPRSLNDQSVDKQLIYVPMYSGYAKLDAGFKKWQLSFRQNYTGYRYTSSDNTQYLEPYMLSSMYIAYSMAIKNAELNVFAQCHNVFNTTYQVVAMRPMPLRHFNFGTTIYFNKP